VETVDFFVFTVSFDRFKSSLLKKSVQKSIDPNLLSVYLIQKEVPQKLVLKPKHE